MILDIDTSQGSGDARFHHMMLLLLFFGKLLQVPDTRSQRHLHCIWKCISSSEVLPRF